METNEGQSGNKLSQKPKVGTREEQSGEQSGVKNPKVGTREEQSGNKSGIKSPKMGTGEEQSGTESPKIGTRSNVRNKVGSRTMLGTLQIKLVTGF